MAIKKCIKSCLFCGSPFHPVDGPSKFCSPKCSLLSRTTKDENNGCWIFLGPRDRDGYGQLKFHGKQYKAHRLSYAAHNGPIQNGMLICHSCDNPSCVNPVHLFIGSHAENQADKVKKGRQAKGSNHGQSKLGNELAEYVKSQLAFGRSGLSLAKELGVAHQTIYAIKHGKTYTHI